MIQRDPTPPLFARATDPDTSHHAGRVAVERNSDRKAAGWVMQVLSGSTRPLNDEEIVEQAWASGCPLSAQRLRAGRKYASDYGSIVEAGRAPLASGTPGRLWRLPGATTTGVSK